MTSICENVRGTSGSCSAFLARAKPGRSNAPMAASLNVVFMIARRLGRCISPFPLLPPAAETGSSPTEHTPYTADA
jgi:hypothetical protein